MDQIAPEPYDLILRGGRVIDPAQGLDGVMDVAVRHGRIAAVEPRITGPASEAVDVSGKLVLPGMIDTHAHVFRYVSGRFGLEADDVGVRSGVTTVVDQGGPSVLTFPGFREYAAKPKATRVLAFISAYMVGGLEGHYYPELYRPECIAWTTPSASAAKTRDLVRGVKGHAEIGGFTRWGDSAMRKASQIARGLDRPLYIHFGQLWPLPGDPAEQLRPRRDPPRDDPRSCAPATCSRTRSPAIPAASSTSTASCIRSSRKRSPAG